jgi:hypothetical protein
MIGSPPENGVQASSKSCDEVTRPCSLPISVPARRRCEEMCVLQCPCGMVVSTDRRQARCLRCGTVLGAQHQFRAPGRVAAEPTKGTDDGSQKEQADRETDGGAQCAERPSALAHHVLLAILAAARSLGQREGGL